MSTPPSTTHDPKDRILRLDLLAELRDQYVTYHKTKYPDHPELVKSTRDYINHLLLTWRVSKTTREDYVAITMSTLQE